MASAPSPKVVTKADSTVYSKFASGNFDPEALKALEELDGCQNKLDTLNFEASKEFVTLEVKFDMLKKPHLNRRAEIINTIPHFWSTACSNHPVLRSLVEEREDYFRHLTKIDVKEFNDITSSVYRIDFVFEDNPYFENAILSKEFHLGSLGNLISFSVPLKWKEGKNLSEDNGPNCSPTGSKRKLDQMSFFTWYNDHLNPASDTIAEMIKDDLWKNPLEYFLDLEDTPDEDIDDEDEGVDASNEEEGKKDEGTEEDQENIICSELDSSGGI